MPQPQQVTPDTAFPPSSGLLSLGTLALILGTVAVGETVIHGLGQGESPADDDEARRGAAAARALGAHVRRDAAGAWHVHGVGLGALREPDGVVDAGGSESLLSLLAGLVAAHPITVFLTGDAAVNERHLARLFTPLELMGASFVSRDGGRPPLAVIGTDQTIPFSDSLPATSMATAAAVLLCGLNTPGTTTVIETVAPADDLARLLRLFGATVTVRQTEDHAWAISIDGQPELTGCAVTLTR